MKPCLFIINVLPNVSLPCCFMTVTCRRLFHLSGLKLCCRQLTCCLERECGTCWHRVMQMCGMSSKRVVCMFKRFAGAVLSFMYSQLGPSVSKSSGKRNILVDETCSWKRCVSSVSWCWLANCGLSLKSWQHVNYQHTPDSDMGATFQCLE